MLIAKKLMSGKQNIAPNAPTNFIASDDRIGEVRVTFTASTLGTTPISYDLYENGALVASNISSGYIRTVSAGARTYYVRAKNLVGYANSASDIGTSKSAGGTALYSTAGTYTFTAPIGYTAVYLDMIGGGGSGGIDHSDVSSGGGYAGGIVSGWVSVIGGKQYTITVGAGGQSADGQSVGGGNAGVQSVAYLETTHIANGGAGGWHGTGSGYLGNGGARAISNWGTTYDGTTHGGVRHGGQAGFGNGGNGGGLVAGGSGDKGSGGGGHSLGYPSGAGGAGYVRITW